MSTRFKIVRDDGRSNQQVILDLVKDAQPGTTYDYDTLCNALSTGTNKTYTVPEIQRIVTVACIRMLKEQARTLQNVRNHGYRIAHGSSHMSLANQRRHKADKQMKVGLMVLQNVKWDELDANQRLAHEGQLLIVGALYQQMNAMERRQSAVERALDMARLGGARQGKG
jgi:hypothetical protein